MARGVHWVSNGRFVPPPEGSSSPAEERALLRRHGFVKIVESESGTLMCWSMFSANWSSLFFAAEWVHGALGPFQLQYYSAGWFNERFEHAHVAAERIRHLIHKSDVHLSQTVYIRSPPHKPKVVPQLLKQVMRDNAAEEDCSIDCLYDQAAQRFRVIRVGPNSTIAKLWGTTPVSYPCLTGHSYDHAVSRIYPQVTRTGEPHYDHIYAAMASANGDVVWVPYQRVVVRLNLGQRARAVRVVTELAEVDICPL
jgi:hypothetical protein